MATSISRKGTIRDPIAARNSRLYCLGFISDVMPRGISPTDEDYSVSIGETGSLRTVDNKGVRFLSFEFKPYGVEMDVGQYSYIRSRVIHDDGDTWFVIFRYFESSRSDVIKMELALVQYQMLGMRDGAILLSVPQEQLQQRDVAVKHLKEIISVWFRSYAEFHQRLDSDFRWYGTLPYNFRALL